MAFWGAVNLKPTYYAECFEIILDSIPPNVDVQFYFQTNATLINDAYCELFKEYNVNIGVSIDGPQFLNDLNRVNRKDKSTFEATLSGIRKLEAFQIPYTVISVLTADLLDYPEEIYHFFTESIHPMSLGFNIDEEESYNGHSSFKKRDEEIEEKFRNFVRTISKLNKNDERLSIREIRELSSAILYGNDHIVNSESVPLAIVSVDKDGNFSTFSPELLTDSSHSFLFGNVNTHQFRDIFKNEDFKKVYREILQGKKRCLGKCPQYSLCGGGAPSNKFFENDSFSSTETINCIYKVKLFSEELLSILEEELVMEKCTI